jgi:hypothetical protein
MKLAIVGTRHEPLPRDIEARIVAIIRGTDPNDVIVTGDCPTGVDRLVRFTADGERRLVVCKAACGMCIRAIVDGLLSPDQDYRAAWQKTIADTVAHYRAGKHPEN